MILYLTRYRDIYWLDANTDNVRVDEISLIQVNTTEGWQCRNSDFYMLNGHENFKKWLEKNNDIVKVNFSKYYAMYKSITK